MKLPLGTVLVEGNSEKKLSMLHKNIYGQTQAGRVRNAHICQCITKIGYKKLVKIDNKINGVISELKNIYEFTNEGHSEGYFGIHV